MASASIRTSTCPLAVAAAWFHASERFPPLDRIVTRGLFASRSLKSRGVSFVEPLSTMTSSNGNDASWERTRSAQSITRGSFFTVTTTETRTPSGRTPTRRGNKLLSPSLLREIKWEDGRSLAPPACSTRKFGGGRFARALVLVPGGTLIVLVPNIRQYYRMYQLLVRGRFPRTSGDPEGMDGGHLHYFTFSDVRELLENAGFSAIALTGTGGVRFLAPLRSLEILAIARKAG